MNNAKSPSSSCVHFRPHISFNLSAVTEAMVQNRDPPLKKKITDVSQKNLKFKSQP